MPWNSDGTPREYKPKLTSKHNEDLNETYYFADGIEIEPDECDICPITKEDCGMCPNRRRVE